MDSLRRIWVVSEADISEPLRIFLSESAAMAFMTEESGPWRVSEVVEGNEFYRSSM